MRSSAAASGQLLTGWTVDRQTEEVTRLAQVCVPVAVRDEVYECQKVEDEYCEEDDEESALIRGCASGSVLLCFYGGVEILKLTWVHDIERRRIVLQVSALRKHVRC